MLSTPIEDIKQRLDVVQVVGEYVKLQKAGANYRALCPFHQEKGPSFFVSPARQSWHCFGGCNEGGDIFAFVMKIEGIQFGDALRLLAQKAGIELPKRDAGSMQVETQRKKLQEVVELATKFFEKQLHASPAGKEAKEYLIQRGVQEKTIEQWRIGYAPDSHAALFEFLQSQGFTEQDIARAGLLVRTEQGTFDRFRGRIIFPITNFQGTVAGFGGRIVGRKEGKDLAKYLNTSNTPLYDKSRILYGLDKAKIAARKLDSFILVEGYMDTIMVAQAEHENVVATAGTALTLQHLQILKRFTDNLILAFDMDIAGDAATKRSIELALAQGFSLQVLVMPGKDPAQVIQENPAAFTELVSKARSVLDFFFETAFTKNTAATPEGKRNIAKVLLPVLHKIENKIEQAHWVQLLATKLGVSETSIQEEMKKIQHEHGLQKAPEIQSAKPKTRRERLEERIVILLFSNPQGLEHIGPEELPFFSLFMQEIIAGMRNNAGFSLHAFQDIFPASTVEILERLSAQAEMEQAQEDWSLEFDLCLRELQMLYFRQRLDEIGRDIKLAEQQKDMQRLDILLHEFHEMSKRVPKV